MSIGRSNPDVEYADHEVQTIGWQVANQEEDDRVEFTKQFEPVYQNGLDSDELGELVAMRRFVNVTSADETSTSQSEVGDAVAEVNAGINLTGKGENPTDAFTNAATADVTDLGDAAGSEGRTYIIDDPGVLDAFRLSAVPGFVDTSAGAAGDGSNVHAERFINFHEVTGTGPFVDKTDDFVISGEVDNRNAVNNTTVEVYYTLYWAIEEMPEGRASFSRP